MTTFDATSYGSWGLVPRRDRAVIRVRSGHVREALVAANGSSVLPYGNGRSYGDSCLNDGGILLDCRTLDRVLAFDRQTGLLRAEVGVLLGSLLKMVVPHGWFLPVVPGTQFVSLGGAIANDVHGKNHHRRGNFGHHVLQLELLRSNGELLLCSPTNNADLFRATIGGLGLTGLITWAEVQLQPVPGALIARQSLPFESIAEFLALSGKLSERHDYVVGWIDALASKGRLGRGLLSVGNHVAGSGTRQTSGTRLKVPFRLPFSLVNRASVRIFNSVYYRMQSSHRTERLSSYVPFFFPLDGIGGWNRLYGPNGLYQHQSVLPFPNAEAAVNALLAQAASSGQTSFLTVLKVFGEMPPSGLLSFARPGVTLTLDFPNQGAQTRALLDELDRITIGAGGAVNPYKDARMGSATFQSSFPQWRDFLPFIDPQFSSSFWRRVTPTLDQ